MELMVKRENEKVLEDRISIRHCISCNTCKMQLWRLMLAPYIRYNLFIKFQIYMLVILQI